MENKCDVTRHKVAQDQYTANKQFDGADAWQPTVERTSLNVRSTNNKLTINLA